MALALAFLGYSKWISQLGVDGADPAGNSSHVSVIPV